MRIVEFFERLPGGTTGVVWRARDEADREVAVKFFKIPIAEIRQQVQNHAVTLGRIQSECVVKIFTIEDIARPDAGEGALAEPALVMEYVPGQTLSDWLAAGKITRRDAEQIISDILEGLGAFHVAKLGHGDLHLKNIRIHNSRAKLIDPIAHDPSAVLSSAETPERTIRDIAFVKPIIAEILRAADANTDAFGAFCLQVTESASLAQLREQCRLALGVAAENTASERLAALSFYRRFRNAQRLGDVVSWQEARKDAKRSLHSGIESWAKKYRSIPKDEGTLYSAIAEGLAAADGLLSGSVSAMEHGGKDYQLDVLQIRDLLRIEWPRSGDTRYVMLPEGLFYCSHYLVGAMGCANGHLEQIRSFSDTRISDRSNRVAALWTNSRLSGWPELFGDCELAFNFLLGAFSRVPMLRDAFPTESSFRTGLIAYNLFLGIRWLVHMDPSTAQQAFESRSGGDRRIPPMFTLMDETELLNARELIFGIPGARNVVLAEAKINITQLRELWPLWVRDSYGFWGSSRPFLSHHVPAEILEFPWV